MTMLCRAYDAMDRFWTRRVSTDDKMMVRVIDAFGISCIYCTAWRALFLGGGIGAVLAGSPYGLLPIAAIALLVGVERICLKGDHR